MWSRRIYPVLLLVIVVILVGCWDRREIEDQAYIMIMGLDRDGDDLVITVTVAQVPMLSAGALNAPVQPHQPFMVTQTLTARGATVTQAIDALNGGMTRQLDVRHLRAVIIGEKLGREGIESVLMELHRHPMARVNVLLAQASGTAFAVVTQLDPVSEVNPARVAEGYLLQAKYLHLAPPARLQQFLGRLTPGGHPFLPGIAVNPVAGGEVRRPGTSDSTLPGELPRGGGNPVELVGTAIYRNDQLRGFLDVDEAQMLLALRGALGKAYISFPDPDEPARSITMRFHQENFPQREATLRPDGPRVHVKLLFEGELLAAPGGTDFVRPENRKRLERAAADYVEQTSREMLAKLAGWEADPIGFGHLYRGRFGSRAQWEEWDWDERVKELTVTVEAQMRVRRYGLYSGPDRVGDGR